MTDLQKAWQVFIDVAKKHWPDQSETLVRLLPAMKAIDTEIHPVVVYEDDGILNLENGVTPDMWVRKPAK